MILLSEEIRATKDKLLLPSEAKNHSGMPKMLIAIPSLMMSKKSQQFKEVQL